MEQGEYIRRTIPPRIKLKEAVGENQTVKKLTKAEIRRREIEEAKNELIGTVKEMYLKGYSVSAISRTKDRFPDSKKIR